MTKASPYGQIDRLSERAGTLAGAWAARARTSTTIGRERAMLRLFGVGGLDAAGRPLAWAAVDRYFAGGRGRLGGGVVLPFAMALVEYDLAPQRLALDVASGAVDLGMEAELLREVDRRAIAEEEARRLVDAAVERIDANRTARRELLGVLGDPPRPWIGTTIPDPEIAEAILASRRALDAGADIIQVEIPIGRELTERLRRAGLDAPVWRPRERRPLRVGRPCPDRQPAGPDRAAPPARRDRRTAPQLRPAGRRAACARRPGVRGRGRVRACGRRRFRPDVRDRRRPRRAGSRPGRPRLRPRAARPGRRGRRAVGRAARRRAGPRPRPPVRRGDPGRTGAGAPGRVGRDRPRQRRPGRAAPRRRAAGLARRRAAAGRSRGRRGRGPPGALPGPGALVPGTGGASARLGRVVGGDRGGGRTIGRFGASILRRSGDDVARAISSSRMAAGVVTGAGRVAGAAEPRRGRARPCPGGGRSRAGHARAAGRGRLAGGPRRSGPGRRAGPTRRGLRRRANGDVRPVRPGADRPSASPPSYQPPDTAGITWTVAPSRSGVSRSACVAVDEDVDVLAKDGAAVDEPVPEPGVRVSSAWIASSTVPASTSHRPDRARDQADERARQDHGHGHAPVPQSTSIAWTPQIAGRLSAIRRHEAPSSVDP